MSKKAKRKNKVKRSKFLEYGAYALAAISAVAGGAIAARHILKRSEPGGTLKMVFAGIQPYVEDWSEKDLQRELEDLEEENESNAVLIAILLKYFLNANGYTDDDISQAAGRI